MTFFISGDGLVEDHLESSPDSNNSYVSVEFYTRYFYKDRRMDERTGLYL